MKSKWLKTVIIIGVFVVVIIATRFFFYHHQPVADQPFLSMENAPQWKDRYGQSVDSLMHLHEKKVLVYLSDSSIVDKALGEKIAEFARQAERSGRGVHGFSIYDDNQNENLRHTYQWAFPLYAVPIKEWPSEAKKGVHVAAFANQQVSALFDFSNCPEFSDWVEKVN